MFMFPLKNLARKGLNMYHLFTHHTGGLLENITIFDKTLVVKYHDLWHLRIMAILILFQVFKQSQ